MIYTKSRRPSQQIHNQTMKQYNYLNQSYNQPLSNNYLNGQHKNCFSHTTSLNRNYGQNAMINNSNKKTDKKYDYSSGLQNNINAEIYPKSSYKQENRYSNSSNQKPKVKVQQNYAKRYSIPKLPSQKIDIKKFLQMNEAQNNNQSKGKYYSHHNYIQKEPRKSFDQINRTINDIGLYEQNKTIDRNYRDKEKYSIGKFNPTSEDNFYFTQKFKQFQTGSKALNQVHGNKYQSSISKAKYQSRYNKMKSKAYEGENNNTADPLGKQDLINRTQIRSSIKFNKNIPTRQKQNFYSHIKNPTQKNKENNPLQSLSQNFLDGSEQQTVKIKQKISRISQLNHQINVKLQNMLLKRNLI